MALTNAERRARYYANPANKARHAAAVKASRERAQAMIREYKDRPCADCGQQFPYWVMDLDHRDLSTKSMAFGNIHRVNWRGERLMAELHKCDVVCANCHRLRHPPEQYANGGCVRHP